MSRSNYNDDLDQWALIRWRGAVASAIRGKRGQALLREMLTALDALPEEELVAGELEEDGKVCALGAVGRCRGMDMSSVDALDPESVSAAFGISQALAQEIVYENDEGAWQERPKARWERMRAWAERHLNAR